MANVALSDLGGRLAVAAARDGGPRVAVLIPCLNEEKTIGKVVRGFRAAIPQALVIVFDNGSLDATATEARAAGAQVVVEKRRGKGHVVRSMFARTDADVFVMVDGDDTYPADRVQALLDPVICGEADMAVGTRISHLSNSDFKAVNRMGNKLYRCAVNWIFGAHITDVLSGYRCMSRRLVRGIPLSATGFEVEAELTIKALQRGYRIVEVPVDLRARPRGSHSKIRVLADGVKILVTVLALFRDYKPLTFFGGVGLLLAGGGLVPGLIAVGGYMRTGLVLHLPSALLAVALELLGALVVVAGIILHTVNRRFEEAEQLLRLVVEEPFPRGVG